MAKKLKIEGTKKKRKWKLSHFEDSPVDHELLGVAHTEIYGNGKISIDGCLGVYEYRDTYLKLKLCKGTMILCGSEFNIIYFEGKIISVKGNISSIEFS